MPTLYKEITWVKIILAFVGIISLAGIMLLYSSVGFSVNFPVFVLINAIFCVGWTLFSFFILWITRLLVLAPENKKVWIPLAFMWGGGIAFVIVMVTGDMRKIASVLGWEASSYSWGGAYPEEIIKLMGVIFIAFAVKEIKRPWHFLVVGLVIGLGFEVVENFGYAIMAGIYDPLSDFDGMLVTWTVRTLIGPWIHGYLTAIAAYAAGWALCAPMKSTVHRWVIACAGWAVAFVAHFIYNYQIEEGLLSYAPSTLGTLLAFSAFIFCVVHAVRMRKEEKEQDSGWELC